MTTTPTPTPGAAPDRPVLKARGPLDLVAMTPYVLGFHPEDSIVLLTFGAPEPFHLRVELPLEPDEQQQVTGLLLTALLKQGVPTVAVLLYTDDVEAAQAQAGRLIEAFLSADLRVVDVLRVTDEAYFELREPDDPGTAYDLSVHPFTASRVFAGKVAHDSRQDLADSLVGGESEDTEAVGLAAVRFAEGLVTRAARGTHPDALLHEEALWVKGIVPEGLARRLAPGEVARLAVMFGQKRVRDVAWAEITRENAADHVELWRDVVRRVPRDLLPPVAALLAFASWLAGDGALAWCAVDRCLEVDPDYSMALELSRLLQHAVAPTQWRGIRPEELDALQPPHRRSA